VDHDEAHGRYLTGNVLQIVCAALALGTLAMSISEAAKLWPPGWTAVLWLMLAMLIRINSKLRDISRL
jgi:hypothetical protein